LSFDPDDVYSDEDTDYYTLWHFKSGKWTSYGKLPHQNPIYWFRARPFQIKLEVAKYGLNPGWHIIYAKSFSDHGTNMPVNTKILRLRHTGSRIMEGLSGYRAPNYYDDNWEILDEVTRYEGETDFSWYNGVPMAGRGFYRPESGIIYDNYQRQVFLDWSVGTGVFIHGWDNTFYTLWELSVEDGTVPSAVMGYTPAWPGTTNTMYGAWYQGYDSDWTERRPLFFHPSSKSDSQPWERDLNMQEYNHRWEIPDQRDSYGIVPLHFWVTNFFFVVAPFTIRYYEDVAVPDYTLSYAVFQGPNNWRTIGGMSPNEPDLKDSMWEWKFDGACAESNMQIAYVRRKSDGSIWRFRNWNPTTGVYTDFTNLDMRPIQPAPNTEYASFFMNGPPIPGNETWNTLMVLK